MTFPLLAFLLLALLLSLSFLLVSLLAFTLALFTLLLDIRDCLALSQRCETCVLLALGLLLLGLDSFLDLALLLCRCVGFGFALAFGLVGSTCGGGLLAFGA